MSLGRILCVTSSFPRWPGDSTTPFVLHLSQDLQQLGWKVTILAPHAPGAKTHEVMDGITVHRFRYFLPESQETVCYQGGALINLRKQRSNYAKLPLLIFCEWIQTLLFLRKKRFDIIHSHWLLPQGFIGILSARLLGIPHACTIHGSDVFALQSPWLNRCKAFTVRHCDAITVNSSATRKAVASLCPTYQPLHTIPMGVSVPTPGALNAGRSADMRSRFRHEQGPLVLFIGRLVEEKGVSDLLEAIAILKQGGTPGITLLAIGEGQDRAIFERQASDLGINESVFFTGWIDPDELPVYHAAADIFAAPSRIEAQGLAIIEAMMAGSSVVATRVGGIIDSITHEETGLLVDERSPDQLASAIERLFNERDLAFRLGKNARETAISKFSRHATAAKFSQLFESFLSPKPFILT